MSRQRIYLVLLGYQHCIRFWLRERGWDRLPPRERHWVHLNSPQNLMGIPREGMVWLQVGPPTTDSSHIREELHHRGIPEMDSVSAIAMMGNLTIGEDA